jgi:hypothetical protein
MFGPAVAPANAREDRDQNGTKEIGKMSRVWGRTGKRGLDYKYI